MKRVIKKRSGKKVMLNKFKLIFSIVFLLYLTSSIFLKNHNISLNHELQNIKNENTNLVNSNQTLKIKIDDLSSFERMNTIAKKNGLENREGSIKNVE